MNGQDTQMSGDADSIAISALSWIAADGEMMGRFLALTGIEPGQIRLAAQEPGFMAGVLDFLLAHEPSLNRFCEDNAMVPQLVAKARAKLGGLNVPGPGDFS